jgi:hypothetical protein
MDDDGFGSDVDVYVDEEHDEEDAELLSRRSSRGALAAKAEQFLRRHSANLPEADTPRATDADLFPDAGGDTNMDAETVVETVVELKRVPSRQEETREQRSRRRDADSVLRDKARLQRFANEAASFLDKAYDNDATLIVDDDVDAETGAKRAPPGGAGSSDDFKKKRYIELDKARLERFSREAEAFIDRAYSDDPSTFIEEEMLSPSSSSLKINSASKSRDRDAEDDDRLAQRNVSLIARSKSIVTDDKRMLEQFHTQAMSFLNAAVPAAILPVNSPTVPIITRRSSYGQSLAVIDPMASEGPMSPVALRRPSSRTSERIAKDKERLERHYQEAMAFLSRAEDGEGEGIVEERELESGALDRVRLKLYASEALSFLENAFAPAEPGSEPVVGQRHTANGKTGPGASALNALSNAETALGSRDAAIDALAARAVAARNARLASGHAVALDGKQVKSCASSSVSTPTAAVAKESVFESVAATVAASAGTTARERSAFDDSSDEEAEKEVKVAEVEAAQIAADRAAMEAFYDQDNFGEDAIVEETLSDTSGGTERGLFARQAGGTSLDQAGEDEWDGDDVSTDDEFQDDDPSVASNVATVAAEREAIIERSLQDMDYSRASPMYDGTRLVIQTDDKQFSSSPSSCPRVDKTHMGVEGGVRTADNRSFEISSGASRDVDIDTETESETEPGGRFVDATKGEKVEDIKPSVARHDSSLRVRRRTAVAATAAGVELGEAGSVAARAGLFASNRSPPLLVDPCKNVHSAERAPQLPNFLHEPAVASKNPRPDVIEKQPSTSKLDTPPCTARKSVTDSNVAFSADVTKYLPELMLQSAVMDEDLLVELLLESSDGSQKNAEWSEVPLEKSFYRSVPRGATIKIRSRASRGESAIMPSVWTTAGGISTDGSSFESHCTRPQPQHDQQQQQQQVHVMELIRVEQERDVVMAALEEIVNERSRMAAQIGEMKATVLETFGQGRVSKTDIEGGDIDVVAELKDSFMEFHAVIKESEATVNVLEGHIADGKSRILDLEGICKQQSTEIESLHKIVTQARTAAAQAETFVAEQMVTLRKERDKARMDRKQAQTSMTEDIDSLRKDLAQAQVFADRKKLTEADNVASLRKELEKTQRDLGVAKADAQTSAASAQKSAVAAAAEAAAALAAAKGSSIAARCGCRDSGIGSSSNIFDKQLSPTGSNSLLWMQLSDARAETDEARQMQERAERRLADLLKAQKTIVSSSEISSAPALDESTSREFAMRERTLVASVEEKSARNELLQAQLQGLSDTLENSLAGTRRENNLLRAELDAKRNDTLDLEQNVKVLGFESQSAQKALRQAGEETAALRTLLEHYRVSGQNPDVTFVQAQLHGLKEECALKERQILMELEAANFRASSAEEHANTLRKAAMAAAEEMDLERRERQVAEAQWISIERNEGSRDGLSSRQRSGQLNSSARGSVDVKAPREKAEGYRSKQSRSGEIKTPREKSHRVKTGGSVDMKPSPGKDMSADVSTELRKSPSRLIMQSLKKRVARTTQSSTLSDDGSGSAGAAGKAKSTRRKNWEIVPNS